jgi:hypothetical protein
VNPGTDRTEPVAVAEEPVVTISAASAQAVKALLNVMEGRLETLEKNLLLDFQTSLDNARNLLANDVKELRVFLGMNGTV